MASRSASSTLRRGTETEAAAGDGEEEEDEEEEGGLLILVAAEDVVVLDVEEVSLPQCAKLLCNLYTRQCISYSINFPSLFFSTQVVVVAVVGGEGAEPLRLRPVPFKTTKGTK